MAVIGCRIRKTENGYAVKNTVFQHRYNAELYAYYLRIALNNGKKIHYVKDFDDAVQQIYKNENRTDKNGSQRMWLKCGWKSNENKYLHVASGMYAVNNLELKEGNNV